MCRKRHALEQIRCKLREAEASAVGGKLVTQVS